MNEKERAAAFAALAPVLRGLLDPAGDGEWPDHELERFAAAIIDGLEATRHRIRAVPELEPGTGIVTLAALNRFMALGPAGSLKIGGLPESAGPGLFAYGQESRVWTGVILQPGVVYDVKPESRLILPS